jgi:hypothetical protein
MRITFKTTSVEPDYERYTSTPHPHIPPPRQDGDKNIRNASKRQSNRTGREVQGWVLHDLDPTMVDEFIEVAARHGRKIRACISITQHPN